MDGVALAMVLGLGVAAFSQFRIQILEGPATLARALQTGRFARVQHVPAKRGRILSRDGRILAQDVEAFGLAADFAAKPARENAPARDGLPKSDGFLLSFARASGRSPADLSAVLAGRRTSVTWKEPIGGGEADAVRSLNDTWRADGITLKALPQRSYPLAAAATGIVGMLRPNDAPLGMERGQDRILRGRNGKRSGLTDRQGNILPTRRESEDLEVVNGADVELTLDSDLQVVASEAIREAVTTNLAENGAAVVMDPQTGDVLAAANWPSFDPYDESGNPSSFTPEQSLNPIYRLPLEPGSTFKILTLAKALDLGVIEESFHINCDGHYKPTPKTVIRCDLHHGNRAHGPVNLESSIARSCNVAAARWALAVGYAPFVQYMKNLGLCDKPSLGLDGVIGGRFNDSPHARRLTLSTFGFGQSMTSTPINLIGAFGMLGNGGVRMTPRLVRSIGGRPVPLAEGVPTVHADTAQKILQYMEAVIEKQQGTGKSVRIPGYRLAGKTGTAQRLSKDTKGNVASFIGFVPARAPRAVILVMVNHPRGKKIYGGEVAGPVFKSLAQAVIDRFEIPPSDQRTARR